jgi:hypothetical protein
MKKIEICQETVEILSFKNSMWRVREKMTILSSVTDAKNSKIQNQIQSRVHKKLLY